MLTVNLEKKMLAINKPIVTARELLILKEGESIASIPSAIDVLERVGMTTNYKNASTLLNKKNSIDKILAKYNKEKVFHISQIKKIADRYYLKFLPSYMFSGNIDVALASKIEQFEIAYGERCDNGNSYIMAPASSFKLEERPKDPLFFVYIGQDYYYLVHKWGNDLSVTRAIIPLFNSRIFYFLSIIIFSVYFLKGLHYAVSPSSENNQMFWTSCITIISLFWFMFTIIRTTGDTLKCSWISKNDYSSQYRK